MPCNPLWKLHILKRMIRATALLAFVVLGGCTSKVEPPPPQSENPPTGASKAQPAKSVGPSARIRVFCQQCHPFVEPAQLPREVWPNIIGLMYRYAGSLETGKAWKENRRDLVNIATHSPYKLTPKYIPDFKAVLDYYLQHSQPAAAYIKPMNAPDVDETQEWKSSSRWAGPTDGPPPSIAHLEITSLKRGSSAVFVVAADMLGGRIVRAKLNGTQSTVVATLKHPAHFVVTDWNGDGLKDLVVAELGSLLGRDTTDGKVTLLEQGPNGSFTPYVLADGLGRVAHIAAGDLDNDGDMDFAVAEFGMMATGSLFALLNQGNAKTPTFEKVILDKRAGFVDVHIADIDGDGKPNIIGLVAQHYEQVMSYGLNPTGGWTSRILADAKDPGWGSTNLAIGDLDGDQDLDIVWLNGDTMDAWAVKPNQGVYWLENTGATFERHFIAYLPGAHKVRVLDVDGDADNDLLISSAYYMEDDVLKPDNAPSVVWLERIASGYKLHAIEVGKNRHFTVAMANIDRDPHPEVVVGNSYLSFGNPNAAPPKEHPAWFTVFDRN